MSAVVSSPTAAGPVRAPAVAPAAAAQTAVPTGGHLDPPTSPWQVLSSPLTRLIVVALVFVAFAAAAAIDRGSTLLHVDRPIERFVVDGRSAWLDDTFRWISFFGSTRVVLIGGLALAIIAWQRCRMVAALVVVTTLARPLLEFTLKESIGRDRPSLDRMVVGEGHSFPSGHVLAAAALWAMVPVVVSLYTRSRRVWWIGAIGAVVAVLLIGASRVYLGVHWTSDVLAGVLAAAMLLAALDAGFRWVHGRRLCGGSPSSSPGA